MDSATLEGSKTDVYSLIKVLKYCTGSTAKSYECKSAVHQVLANKDPPSPDKIGEAIREVINHSTIRGKFNGVHDDLKKFGVTKIEIRDDGLEFVGKLYFRFLLFWV